MPSLLIAMGQKQRLRRFKLITPYAGRKVYKLSEKSVTKVAWKL
jgi:hypothetical protein